MSITRALSTRLKVVLNAPQPWAELVALLNDISSVVSFGAYPSNVYTVDLTVGSAIPSLRVYPSVDTAWAAGIAGGVDFAINILPGQGNIVNGPLALTKNVTVRCAYGGRAGVLAAAAGLGFTGGTGKTVRLVDLTLNQAGAIVDATGLDVVELDNVRNVALGGGQWIGWAGVAVGGDSQVVGARYVTIGQNSPIGFNWSNSAWTPGAGFPAAATVFGMSASVVNTFRDCDINAEGIDSVTLWSRSANNPVAKLHGTNVAVQNSGAGTSTLFSSPSLTADLKNVQVTRTGAGLVNFGNAVVNPFAGLSWHGTDPGDALPAGTWHNVAGTITQVP